MLQNPLDPNLGSNFYRRLNRWQVVDFPNSEHCKDDPVSITRRQRTIPLWTLKSYHELTTLYSQEHILPEASHEDRHGATRTPPSFGIITGFGNQGPAL
jgi:hypothetical protein